jgi:hypothetical protein
VLLVVVRHFRELFRHDARQTEARVRKMHFIGSFGAGLAVLAAASSAPAAILTTSLTAPSSAAISQADFSGPAFNGSQDFTDNAGPPGQTFTPATNLSLTAIAVKGFANTSASFGGVNTGSWTVTISRVDAGNVLTRLSQETADPSAVTDGSAYVTLALTNPVALIGGTQYAFDIFSSTGYFGLAKSSTDVYAGGSAIQHGTTSRTSADGAAIANIQQGVDRTFFINPPVPEPGSMMMLALAGTAAMIRRRRAR